MQFEWAWQHPAASRRLQDAKPRPLPGEQPIAFALRMLPRLLWAPPWCRLPLRLRWLRPPPGPALCPTPPPHVVMEMSPGGLKPRPRKRPTPTLATPPVCMLCLEPCEVRFWGLGSLGSFGGISGLVGGISGPLIGYFGAALVSCWDPVRHICGVHSPPVAY